LKGSPFYALTLHSGVLCFRVVFSRAASGFFSPTILDLMISLFNRVLRLPSASMWIFPHVVEQHGLGFFVAFSFF